MKLRNEQRYQLTLRAVLLTTLAGAITLWGLLALYRTLALTGQWSGFLIRQSVWALIAWSLFFLVSRMRFENIMRFTLAGTVISAASLLLLPLLGVRLNGMCGWYSLWGITLQPSEIAKAFYLLAIVKILHDEDLPEKMRLLFAALIIIIFAVLIGIQPDFGTMSVYLAGGFGALYFSRVKMKYLFAALAAALLASLAFIVCNPYMISRIKHFIFPALDPAGGSWHLRQFSIAVARGEWFGVKANMAVWSNSYLPLAHNDSIFAAMCEMLGFCGGIILLLLYAGFFYQAFSMSLWQRNNLRRSVIDSMSFMILFQTLLHIAVNLNLLPPTGVTLPLISYGGSSMTGTMLMLAIIISANKRDKTPLSALKSNK